jgi:hypothetical protein
MTRVAFRLAFTKQPPTIVCAGCGEESNQAGIALSTEDIHTTHAENGEPVSTIDTSRAEPLCENCVKLQMATTSEDKK